MSSPWIRTELGDNILQFSNGEETLFSPQLIGERYLVTDILSVSGGFGIIFIAQDTRMLGREVLVKARRYDKEANLFSYAKDLSRKDKIRDIRELVLFEFDCLLNFRRHGESRMPNVNDLVYNFSPILHGPHTDENGNKFTITDPEIINNEPYIIMQMIDGYNMGSYLKKGVDAILADRGYDDFRLWERTVLQYALELVTIFGNFHRIHKSNDRPYYFIYQDLKPDNIMLTYDTFLTLLDFGGMTLVRSDDYGQMKSNWPRSGSPGLGTYGYKAPEMNPELRSLSSLDQRVDVYALGATIYHMLTGDDPTKFDHEYGNFPIERLRKFKYKVTEATFELIEKATLDDRTKRFATVHEMKSKIYEGFQQLKDFNK